jgi:succinate-semialdehyde dehydrogenase/glutarate-semialdehyde dehydrogenase
VLRKLYDLMMAHQDDLGAIMTAEQGKPAEAKGEIAYGAAYVEWFTRKRSVMATRSPATRRTSASLC